MGDRISIESGYDPSSFRSSCWGIYMKKLAIALTALAAFTAPALAADIARRAPPPVAPAPIAYAPSWTGFWISGGFGYGFADDF
jgi:hypothetical protein